MQVLLLSLTPQILYTLLLRKRLIPPKRSHQSFLKLKKNRCFTSKSSSKKRMLQNWKGSNSEFSRLFLFLFIYIWYTDLDSAYQPYCIESCFYFSLNKLDVILFVTLCMRYKKMEQQQQLLHFCDSKHPLVFIPDYRGGGKAHKFFIFLRCMYIILLQS